MNSSSLCRSKSHLMFLLLLNSRICMDICKCHEQNMTTKEFVCSAHSNRDKTVIIQKPCNELCTSSPFIINFYFASGFDFCFSSHSSHKPVTSKAEFQPWSWSAETILLSAFKNNSVTFIPGISLSLMTLWHFLVCVFFRVWDFYFQTNWMSKKNHLNKINLLYHKCKILLILYRVKVDNFWWRLSTQPSSQYFTTVF